MFHMKWKREIGVVVFVSLPQIDFLPLKNIQGFCCGAKKLIKVTAI